MGKGNEISVWKGLKIRLKLSSLKVVSFSGRIVIDLRYFPAKRKTVELCGRSARLGSTRLDSARLGSTRLSLPTSSCRVANFGSPGAVNHTSWLLCHASCGASSDWWRHSRSSAPLQPFFPRTRCESPCSFRDPPPADTNLIFHCRYLYDKLVPRS